MSERSPKPIDAISTAFQKGRPAFMPYFTLGYPDFETSLEVVEACAGAGADLMELGIPFSDPLADGPTIQHSSQVALEGGMTVARCLEAVGELRLRGVEIPFMLMGYYNPILSFGVERFISQAARSGANGFIVPDLPPEEAGELDAACTHHHMGLSYLLAPNSTEDRIRLVGGKSRGFTYLVSVTGITGARSQLPSNLLTFIHRVRRYVITPLAVGFGISTPAQAAAVGEIADGVIVGSALVKTVGDAALAGADPAKAAGDFVRSLCQGLTR